MVPATVLVTLLGLASLLAYRTARALGLERAQLRDQSAELASLRLRMGQEHGRLAPMRTAAAPANAFMAHWRAALGPGHDGNAILSDLSRCGNEQAVAVQNRHSGAAEYPWKGRTLHFQSAEGEGISGEYYRLINWLGAVEHTWPAARIEQAALEQRGASLRLFLKLSYPSFLSEAPQ